MNGFEIKEDSFLREKYYYTTHRSGLRVLVIPKDFSSDYACLGVGFGARDNIYSKEGGNIVMPVGTAHFLEHKIFEKPDGSDALADFDICGGNANAYTSFDSTCFYFSCTENLSENLRILLRTVTGASFTRESVEKEKKIITEEIRMYEDSPNTLVSGNLMKALYYSHPLREPLSGTAESVAAIDKELLDTCRRDFYVPSNMVLAVCTKSDPQLVLDAVDEFFPSCSGERPLTIIPTESDFVAKDYVSDKRPIASPLFCIGFKCAPMGRDMASLRRGFAVRTALSMIFGRASDFFCENYRRGLVNERFSVSFDMTDGASYCGIGGSSRDPNAVLDKVISELKYRKEHFFTEAEFEREKKAAYAGNITLFDSSDDIVHTFVADALNGYDEYDCIGMYRDLTPEETVAAFESVIDTEKHALSVLYGE